MRQPFIALLAAVATTASALPRGPQTPPVILQSVVNQLPFSLPPSQQLPTADAVDSIASTFNQVFETAGRYLSQVKDEAERLIGDVEGVAERVVASMAGYGFGATSQSKVEKVDVDGISYELVTHKEFPEHALRIVEGSTLCDPSVTQYSGYLDISETKHLFFWFFESRSKPSKDPLVMWLNGGPGCSSSTGLLMELGPCTATEDGDTKFNEFGWNRRANMLFLDQPVSVGFSYTDGGDSINNSVDSAKDVYAFLQLFYSKFSQYASVPFTVAAESYGGTYAPHIASRIYQENSNLKSRKGAKRVPLETIMIGNGLTDPMVQFASVPEYGCPPSEHAVFDEATCQSLRAKVPTCQRLQSYCYSSPSRFTCVPATLYCWSALYGPFQQLGLNPYDVRKKCDRAVNPLCYEEMNWIENYLNKAEVKKTLGVPSSIKFQSCNFDVNRAFQLSGDNMVDSAALLPDLLASGVRLLVYAGTEDFMCNYLGNEEWMLALSTPFQAEFSNSSKPYRSDYKKGEVVGHVRSAGRGGGNFTFVSLEESGHMVPHDQPEVAVELLDKWLANEPLA